MIINKTCFTAGIVALWALSMFAPSTAFAQSGPDSVPQRGQGRQEGPAYDATSEATFTGTVGDLKTGRNPWSRLQETQLLLKTSAETVEIQLGPTAFLTGKKVEIRKGDALEITGSRVTVGESHLILAREVRSGNNAWTLRDATGQPLWSSLQTETAGFWTKKKILFAMVAGKVLVIASLLMISQH